MSHGLTDQLRHTALRPEFEQAWRRQRATAADILGRLETQEGVILADQVGLGKTFVALAVAVSRILDTRRLGQVVVLVPPAVADKWVNEWATFRGYLPEGNPLRCVDQPLRSGEELLAALDDPPASRRHLVIVTHTALTTTLKSTFVQLALVHSAIRGRTGAERRRRLVARCSEGRRGLFNDSSLTPERVQRLLGTPPETWRDVWVDLTDQDLDDDVVPAAALAAMRELDLSLLRAVIDSLPRNRTPTYRQRLAAARTSLNLETRAVWKSVLASTRLRLPLLIVDEAHRLKNPGTLFSQLFAPRAPGETSGALAGIFDRMLMLTATPFELGHHELIQVLSRLEAVRRRPPGLAPISERLESLGDALTDAQRMAVKLDDDWGRLTPSDAHWFDSWAVGTPAPPDGPADVRAAWNSAVYAAQSRRRLHRELRPWIIRHAREPRRSYLPGAAVADGSPHQGLRIEAEVALPFLLAARAQAMAADAGSHGAARPLFAYGIASSFEAFRRLEGGENPRDSDNPPDEDESTEAPPPTSTDTDAVRWYRKEIDALLVKGGIDRAKHPKVRATVKRATELWWHGDKCVVFCWYIATGRAVEQALQASVQERVLGAARTALNIGPKTPAPDVEAELARIATALDRERPAYRQLSGQMNGLFRDAIARSRGRRRRVDVEELTGHLVGFAIRHLRLPSYLVRYTHLRSELRADNWWRGIRGDNPTGVALDARWVRFAQALAEFQPDERARIIAALENADLEDVRRAHGGTDRHTRERLTATFNTPFAPDLLVASSVMGEGIDLHRECRHVIHHDLDWNPSVLEQRTGRLDRIGSLSESLVVPIDVYEPYLAGTHDEKMYRVVKDRERWFGVVMGRAAGADEHATDREESRLPLSEAISTSLTMDLRSSKGTTRP